MNDNLASQYNEFSAEYIQGNRTHNQKSRRIYYAMLNFDMIGKKVLDVGCGDGFDLSLFHRNCTDFYGNRAYLYGVDASKEMIQLAQKNVPEANLRVGLFEKLPYQDNFFDVVLTKYALQTSKNIPLVLKEMDRVLRPGGIMAYLVVHPTRQFLEKKKHPKNYFIQEIVESTFFEGTVTAREPTHTFNEYFNTEFLRKYHITYFREEDDFPSAEKIDGDTYPCFFVLKAEKIKS